MNISKVFASIIVVVSFAFIPPVVSAQQLSKTDQQFVDSIMNANYKPGEPGAVMLIAKKGQPVFRKAYGLANLEFNISNKPEYIFRIGSMSKQFTAVCILKLAQEGKLNLQDDITKYLPVYNTHGRHITIENLLTHTSGIIDPQYKPDYHLKVGIDQSDEELMNSFMNDSLFFEPGTDWSYSNSGYVLAKLIIEKISGISLKDYLQQNIFDPLGMSHTSVGNSYSIISNAANGYYAIGTGKFEKAGYFSWTWVNGPGAILSNVDDLLKWDNALYTDKIIKQEWLEKAWKPFVLPNGQTTNYGFGWGSSNFQGVQILEHGGGINGFSSDGLRVPSQHLYVVILSNSTIIWPPVISSAIALHILRLTVPQPSSVKIDKKTLESYTGVYALHLQTEWRKYQYFTARNDTLFAQTQGYPGEILLYVSKDLFVSQNQNPYYYFHRDKEGNVISVESYNEPLKDGGLNQLEFKTDIPLPKEVVIDVKKLELLKGKYDFGGGVVIPITLDGNHLYLQQPGQEKEEIFAENETHFFSKKNGAAIEFIKDNDKISRMIVISGVRYEGKKIE